MMMSHTRKRAFWCLAIWGPVTIAFAILFLVVGSPATYTDDEGRRNLVGGLFTAGYVAYAVMRYVTRVKDDDEHVMVDERDEEIQRRASQGGFIVVLLYVFLLALGLWEAYEDQGAVPVGWMWFLAYSTNFVAFIATSTATLILHARPVEHA